MEGEILGRLPQGRARGGQEHAQARAGARQGCVDHRVQLPAMGDRGPRRDLCPGLPGGNLHHQLRGAVPVRLLAQRVADRRVREPGPARKVQGDPRPASGAQGPRADVRGRRGRRRLQLGGVPQARRGRLGRRPGGPDPRPEARRLLHVHLHVRHHGQSQGGDDLARQHHLDGEGRPRHAGVWRRGARGELPAAVAHRRADHVAARADRHRRGDVLRGEHREARGQPQGDPAHALPGSAPRLGEDPGQDRGRRVQEHRPQEEDRLPGRARRGWPGATRTRKASRGRCCTGWRTSSSSPRSASSSGWTDRGCRLRRPLRSPRTRWSSS